jgi:hypothetical protein
MLLRGGKTFNKSAFKQYINKFYYPLENMQDSVDRLKIAEAAKRIDMQTMEYGSYQPILAPTSHWPNNLGLLWERAVDIVMTSFGRQGNTEPVSPDDPRVFDTKRKRLNAAIQKCFNSDPPIPMFINVKEKPEGANDPYEHDIELVWEYDPDFPDPDNPPTLLFLTMVCVNEKLFPPEEIPPE